MLVESLRPESQCQGLRVITYVVPGRDEAQSQRIGGSVFAERDDERAPRSRLDYLLSTKLSKLQLLFYDFTRRTVTLAFIGSFNSPHTSQKVIMVRWESCKAMGDVYEELIDG